jgi:nucleotide-binding universal stress UspA family protein
VEEKYQFDMLPSIDSQAAPKRNTQGDGGFFGAGATSNTAKRRPNSMSAVFGSGTLGPDGRPKGTKSSSPAPRSGRSQSPANKSLNSNKLKSTPGTYVSSDGKVINLDQAYRRLSDAALLKSGGRLADLPTSKNVNADRGEELAPDGGVRVTKDYYEDDEDNDGSSEEEEDENYNSDDSDASQAFGSRGRARARADSELSDTPREAKSLLAAAEQERKDVSTSQSKKAMKSMLDISPAVHSKAGLSADQLFFKKEKPVIHPRTSYDHGNSSGMGLRSGMSTPDIVDSDEERTKNDFDTAQKMAITLSPIHSSPEAHRCIRQILRGDFRKYQLEAEQGLRRQRMYLVATDLSEEAAYALEWTIGTVLRDGDTLLAVYAVDEEAGTGEDVSTTVTANNSVAIGEGSKQMNEAAAIVRTLSNEQGLVVPGERSAYRKSTDVGGSRRSSSHVRTRSKSKGVYKDKAESERYHATQEISDRCIKLLRKTKLQVRVVVEVFHCKSPKHMITEVVSPSLSSHTSSHVANPDPQIDYLEPTLVILGSRGRSALKGVLLGSFSNYLVTKSSVPVMVARKKLRHSKKGPGTRLSNMLATPGSRLESAVIDRPSMGTRRGSVGT